MLQYILLLYLVDYRNTKNPTYFISVSDNELVNFKKLLVYIEKAHQTR